MKGGFNLLQQLLGEVLDNTPSPAGSWLGFTLLSVEKGKAAVTLKVRHEMCNPYGNIHGGMMSMVVDEAIGFAIISLDLEIHYTSVNLNVDFLYAIQEGETLRAEAEIIRYGKKIMNAEVKVYNHETNTLLAKASSNLTSTSMHLDKMG
ncbi:MAG TPA: PaaI family thioesterase [Edaphocola sp.]|nr:PaaI family thioesterase [Edaphocola sp.]